MTTPDNAGTVTRTGLATPAGARMKNFDAKFHWQETLRDGSRVLIRPLTSTDAGLEQAFLERLSPESLSYRFLGQVRITADMIRKLTAFDSRRDMAFVALRHDDGAKQEIGVSRFCASDDGTACECAVTVSDEWQGKGLGYLLMRHLIEVARQRGIKRMYSIDSAQNQKMRALATDLGFTRKVDPEYPSEVIFTLEL